MFQQKDSLINSANFIMTLSDHMVLQSDSSETDVFMNTLEANSILPMTVTWYGPDGFTNRLYSCSRYRYLSGPFDINLGTCIW